jgi:hypothetical protein
MLSGKIVRTDQALELAAAMFYRIIRASSVTRGSPKKSASCTTLRHIRDSTGISLVRVCDLTGTTMESSAEPPISTNQYPCNDPAMARYLKDYFDSILPSARTEVGETVRELMWVMLKSGVAQRSASRNTRA